MGKWLLSLFAIVLIVAAALAAFYLLYYLPLTQDLEDARRDVDRDVAQASVGAQEGVDEQPRLDRRAASELDEHRRLLEAVGDGAGASLEDLVLGAGEVVLGEVADLLEEE